MDKDKYILSVNYKGQDVQLVVKDLEVAEQLVNDNAAAETLLDKLCPNGEINEPVEISVQTLETTTEELENQNPSTLLENQSSGQIIWTRKRPTEEDLEATAEPLKLRANLSSSFDDKKSVKNKLWQKIGNELGKKYAIGPHAGEKCRQKFANLQKSYVAYRQHQNTTGTGKHEKLPPFFEEIHAILGDKAKVVPVNLQDSMEFDESLPSTSTSEPCTSASVASTSAQDSPDIGKESSMAVSRFKKSRTRMRPKSVSEQVLKEIQSDAEVQKQQFLFVQEHLKKSKEQRERFLNILENVFSRKRKRNERGSMSDSE